MRTEATAALAQQLGLNKDKIRCTTLSGGSIARAYKLSDGTRRLFIKCMNASEAEILRCEQRGLQQLAETRTIRVPAIIGSGQIEEFSWLALSWHSFRPMEIAGFRELGQQLAQLHGLLGCQFGLEENNFIGRTRQINQQTSDWTTFFFQHRLGVQLDLMDRNHPGHEWRLQLENLHERWQQQFADYRPEASLLHGDLWIGNVGLASDDQPMVFDPAVHYGDRECDLAMTDLFGGFDDTFYAHYQEAWPLSPGWLERRRFYQLYHLLNHANLFGGHYVQACKQRIRELGLQI